MSLGSTLAAGDGTGPAAPRHTRCRRPSSITRVRETGQPGGVLLEDVLDLLAGLLHVGLGLVRLALGLHVLVVRRLAERLLGRADLLVGHVLHLVVGAHDGAPSGVLGAVRLCRTRSAAVARGCSGRTRRFSWQTLPPPQASRRAAATRPRNSPASSWVSGCHCTPTQNLRPGCSTASTVPSAACAAATSPGWEPTDWWWWQRTSCSSPTRPATVVPGTVRTMMSPNRSAPGEWS